MRPQASFPHEFIDFVEEFRAHEGNMTRFCVLVKTRYNVRQKLFWRVMNRDMSNEKNDMAWFDRFLELIEASKAAGRDYKEISREAGLGQNYVQQMVKHRKQPTVEKFLAIMNVLGKSKVGYVMTGAEITEEDMMLVEAAAALPPTAKPAALDFFRQLATAQDKPTRTVVSQE